MVGLTNEMAITLVKCNAFGLDFPYKEWKIKPFKVNDYFEFAYCSNILDIDKNSLGNIEFIQMSYLKFLMDIVLSQDSAVITKLSLLFHIVLGNNEDVKINKDEKGRYSFVFNDKIMTSKDFDIIRKIILYQNLKDYKDMSNVDPYIKKAIEEYKRIKSGNIESPTLEKKIAVIQSQNGMTKQELCNMSIREFEILFETVIEEIDYSIAQNARLSQCEMKDKIEHWVYKENKSMFSDAFVSYDKVENKINKANA